MSRIHRRSLLQLSALAPLVALVGAGSAFAQTGWPAKPIRFVVGFPPGQSADLAARQLAAVMGRDLGQAVFVDNRAGANGIAGAQEVKQSPPDGYTVLYGTSGQLGINPGLYRKLPYDPLKDFAPVGKVLNAPLFVIAHPSFPADNVQELIAYARANPGKIDFGSGGNGVTGHLAMALLQAAAGIKVNHVPYKGSPAAFNDLLGGRIALMIESGGISVPAAKAGQVKVLASTGARRPEGYATVATVAEQGVKDFDVVAWNGLLVPAGTPAPIVERLNASLRRALVDPAIVEMLRKAGWDAEPSTPAEFGAFLRAEIPKWTKAVAEAGAQVD